MIFVIPYAFSSVLKQLEAEQILEARREAEKQRKYAEWLAARNETTESINSTTEASNLLSEVANEPINT